MGQALHPLVALFCRRQRGRRLFATSPFAHQPPEKTKSPRAPSLPTTQKDKASSSVSKGLALPFTSLTLIGRVFFCFFLAKQVPRPILRPSLDGEGEQRLRTTACPYWFAPCCPGARGAVMRTQRAARGLGRQVSSTSLLLHTPTRVHFCRIFSSLVRLLPSPFHLGAPWTTAIPRLKTEGWLACPTRLCTPS